MKKLLIIMALLLCNVVYASEVEYTEPVSSILYKYSEVEYYESNGKITENNDYECQDATYITFYFTAPSFSQITFNTDKEVNVTVDDIASYSGTDFNFNVLTDGNHTVKVTLNEQTNISLLDIAKEVNRSSLENNDNVYIKNIYADGSTIINYYTYDKTNDVLNPVKVINSVATNKIEEKKETISYSDTIIEGIIVTLSAIVMVIIKKSC